MGTEPETDARGISISAVLPAFNEAPNLAGVVSELTAVLAEAAPRFEIIVVDDGSRDGTSELADRLAKDDPRLRVIHHPRNLGYGSALRSGFGAAQYDWIFFMDSDGQFLPSEIKDLIRLSREHVFVAGYRARRQDPWPRRFYSALFSALVRALFGVKARDVNCAFKLFQRRLIAGVELISPGALINAELLAAAKDQGVNPLETPVTHRPRLSGRQTGGSLKVILRALTELVRLYLHRRKSRTT